MAYPKVLPGVTPALSFPIVNKTNFQVRIVHHLHELIQLLALIVGTHDLRLVLVLAQVVFDGVVFPHPNIVVGLIQWGRMRESLRAKKNPRTFVVRLVTGKSGGYIWGGWGDEVRTCLMNNSILLEPIRQERL